MTINIIDTHAHVVLGKAFGKAGKYGPDTGLIKMEFLILELVLIK